MNNDLISREALKKAIEQIAQDYVDDNFFWAKLFNLIDNAPTVDALPREYHDRVLDMTVAELQACQANLRPQGKWIKRINEHFKCANCNQYSHLPFNFCPNCGAKMKGD